MDPLLTGNVGGSLFHILSFYFFHLFTTTLLVPSLPLFRRVRADIGRKGLKSQGIECRERDAAQPSIRWCHKVDLPTRWRSWC